jgi:hypothetical protein
MLKALRRKVVPRWLMVTKWCELRVLLVVDEFTPHEAGVVS